MIVNEPIEIKRIEKKLAEFFDLDTYFDFILLNSNEFLLKYGFYGFSFNNFLSVRFDDEPDIIDNILCFLPQAEYFVIPVTGQVRHIHKMSKKDVKSFLEDEKVYNFIILELKMTWLIVYDEHRKFHGLGNFIKKKMRQNINLKFGNTKIMFTNFD